MTRDELVAGVWWILTEPTHGLADKQARLDTIMHIVDSYVDNCIDIAFDQLKADTHG